MFTGQIVVSRFKGADAALQCNVMVLAWIHEWSIHQSPYLAQWCKNYCRYLLQVSREVHKPVSSIHMMTVVLPTCVSDKAILGRSNVAKKQLLRWINLCLHKECPICTRCKQCSSLVYVAQSHSHTFRFATLYQNLASRAAAFILVEFSTTRTEFAKVTLSW